MGAVCLPLEKRDEMTYWKLLLRREVSIQEIKMLSFISSFIGKLPAESSGERSLGILGAHLDAQQSRKQVLSAGGTVGCCRPETSLCPGVAFHFLVCFI